MTEHLRTQPECGLAHSRCRPQRAGAGSCRDQGREYGGPVDHAIYTLNILRPEGLDGVVARLREQLTDPDGPIVEIDRWPAALRFRSQMWRPTLVERVNAALDADIGREERERRFRAF
jgi:hypothetical protein